MGFSYSKKAEVGKAYIQPRGRHFVVYVWETVGTTSTATKASDKVHYNLQSARVEQAEINDWQCLGCPGHEVYKGNDLFNRSFDVKPWEHIYLSKDKVFFFIWDTRELTKVAKRPANLDDKAIKHYLRIENSDNGKPICKNGKWLSQSELLKQPVNFKTKKQIAAGESDMAVMTSDNTGMAMDVSNVGSADAPMALGTAIAKSGPGIACNVTNGKSKYALQQRHRQWYLYSANGALLDSAMTEHELMQRYNLKRL